MSIPTTLINDAITDLALAEQALEDVLAQVERLKSGGFTAADVLRFEAALGEIQGRADCILWTVKDNRAIEFTVPAPAEDPDAWAFL